MTDLLLLRPFAGLADIPIRQLISRLGLAISILIVVMTPAVFWFMHIGYVGKDLEFKGRLNADRVARLVFASDQLWQYQGLRISELIDLGNAEAEYTHQRVRTDAGLMVVEVGPDVGTFAKSVTRPIVVRGQTVGHLDIAVSLWPSIYRTFLVGLISALLGLAAFLVLRVFPVAALDQALAKLEEASARISATNAELATKNAELSSLNQSLESRVGERTAEAERAAEAARQASQVKSMFLASMSHEIRTPMNGILGMADLLSRSDLSAKQVRLVATINQSARTLLTIINDILDFSRIEAGKLEIDAQEFDLRHCVESAVEILAEDAARKGLELDLLLPSSLPAFVVGDAGRLRQVLVNVIGNAVKFTREGEVTVRVADCGERDGRSVIRCTVADTGIGIDKAMQERLFKPFSQGDSSISRSFGGTGLGLTITQNIVQLMGGEVTFESEVGKGTTVTIEVTLAISTRQNRNRVICPSALAGARVLVVDDRAVNREIVSSYLGDCGAITATAESGEAALPVMRAASAAGEPFAVAVLDMILPGIDGLELARRIKADPELTATRLVMLTSLSWKGDAASARDVGIGEFVTKPIRRVELLDAIRNCFAWPPTAGTPIAPKPIKSLPLKGKRVLVAEDNPVNQEVARQYALSLGCECEIAENGLVAVDMLTRTPFDIVLMDCQMPEMDGLAASERIREMERERGLPRTPIIAVTANAYESDRQQCLAAGMDDFLGKPFTEPELAAKLGKWSPGGVKPVEAGGTVVAALDAAPAATLDANVLGAFEAIKAGGAGRLVEMFKMTGTKAVRQIMLAIIEDDREKISAAAHGLRSSAGNVGALELQRLAGCLEDVVRRGESMMTCLALASRLDSEMREVEMAMSRTPWLAKAATAG